MSHSGSEKEWESGWGISSKLNLSNSQTGALVEKALASIPAAVNIVWGEEQGSVAAALGETSKE